MTALLKTATCLGCGCTDDHACPGGCGWLRLDRDLGAGVCSECERLVAAWDAGALQVRLGVRIKLSCGAYVATLGRLRASSTCSAAAAIERALAKHPAAARLVVRDVHLKHRLPGTGVEHWEAIVSPAPAKGSP